MVTRAFFRRAFDYDLGDRGGLAEGLFQIFADGKILVQEAAVILAREPAAIPGAVDAEAHADRIDFLAHGQAPFLAALAAGADGASAGFASGFLENPLARDGVICSSSVRSLTTIVRLLNGFSMPAERPRPRA